MEKQRERFAQCPVVVDNEDDRFIGARFGMRRCYVIFHNASPLAWPGRRLVHELREAILHRPRQGRPEGTAFSGPAPPFTPLRGPKHRSRRRLAQRIGDFPGQRRQRRRKADCSLRPTFSSPPPLCHPAAPRKIRATAAKDTTMTAPENA